MTIAEYAGLRKTAFDRLKAATPDRQITLREQLAEIEAMLPRQIPAPNSRSEAKAA